MSVPAVAAAPCLVVEVLQMLLLLLVVVLLLLLLGQLTALELPRLSVRQGSHDPWPRVLLGTHASFMNSGHTCMLTACRRDVVAGLSLIQDGVQNAWVGLKW